MRVAKGVREINWFWLFVSALAWPAVVLLCFHVLLAPAVQMAHITGGLVQPTLFFSVLLFVIVIIGCVRCGGGLRATDIGLTASTIPTGFVVTLSVWVTVQGILLIVALLESKHAVTYNNGNWTTVLGVLGAQLLGNAFVEETMFRGFLIPQIYLKLRRQTDPTHWLPMLWAIVLATLGFALIHIPNLDRLGGLGGGSLGKLTMIFLSGMFFALLYVRTSNIFVCIGVHALINKPTPLVRPMVRPEALVFFLALLILVFWPRLSKRMIKDRAAGSSS